MTQVQKRKGLIVSIDGIDGWGTICAEVPLNEMFGYVGELRSSTEGKGEFTMEYARYSPCTPEVTERLVREYQEAMGILPEESKKKKKN